MRPSENIRKRLPWLLGGLLVLGCWWIYRDVVGFAFVDFDDDYNIVFNPHLGPLSWARVEWAFTDWSYMRRYVPLGWLGFSAVFGVSGLNPAGYHAAALGFHIINTVLVAAVLSRFAARELGGETTPWRTVVIFFATAFWAWHPLRVESVAWASGLLYSQTIFWSFAALWCHLGERRTAALVCHTLALLSYPVALGLWPLFVLLDARRDGWRRSLVRNLGHVLVALVVLGTTLLARVGAAAEWRALPNLAEFPLWQRALQALYVWAHYLWRPWWPVGFSPVYPVLLDIAHPSWLVLGGVVLLLAVAAWLGWSPKARAAVGWFFLAHLAALVPQLGLTETPYFPPDRYAYLVQLVLAAALVLLLARVPSRHFALGTVCAGVLVLCASLSRAQTEIWRDSASLWRRITASISPDVSPGLVYARPGMTLLRAGKTAEAFALVNSGLARRPGDPALLAAREDFLRTNAEVRASAMALGLTALPPPDAVLHFTLAAQLARAGETEAAAQHLAEVARLAPEYYDRVTRRAPLPPAR